MASQNLGKHCFFIIQYKKRMWKLDSEYRWTRPQQIRLLQFPQGEHWGFRAAQRIKERKAWKVVQEEKCTMYWNKYYINLKKLHAWHQAWSLRTLSHEYHTDQTFCFLMRANDWRRRCGTIAEDLEVQIKSCWAVVTEVFGYKWKQFSRDGWVNILGTTE